MASLPLELRDSLPWESSSPAVLWGQLAQNLPHFHWRGKGLISKGRNTQGRLLCTPCACYCYNKSQSCVWKG